ncbi:MAG: hypothetical protein U0670_02775 [Anaerolineae bacterium]
MGRLWRILAAAAALSFGLIVLFGLLLGDVLDAVLQSRGLPAGIPAAVTSSLLQIAAITVAITVLIGLLNLYNVHLLRLIRRQRGSLYSVVMLVSAGAVIAFWITGQRDANRVLLDSVQVALESALAGLVLFALVYGAYRFMRRGVTVTGLLFTAVVLIMLIGVLPGDNVITQLRAWLLAVPVSAGERGILLGIALATVVTGVRVLAGQDRNYRE